MRFGSSFHDVHVSRSASATLAHVQAIPMSNHVSSVDTQVGVVAAGAS